MAKVYVATIIVDLDTHALKQAQKIADKLADLVREKGEGVNSETVHAEVERDTGLED